MSSRDSDVRYPMITAREVSHFFNKGRCCGHEQFNGRYCRDVAGPERWCINCAGFMLLSQLTTAREERDEAIKDQQDAERENDRALDLIHKTVVALESQLTALRQEKRWPSEAQLEGLKDYAIWHGSAHTSDCPGDDTCDCACKPLNDAVNSILGEWFDRSVTASTTEKA